MARTGVGVAKLLRGTKNNRPRGLSANVIHGWLSGATTSANPEHIKWVFDAYANYKPPAKAVERAPRKIKLGDAEFKLIQKEAQRTGLGAIDILRHAPKPLPEGLNHQKVQRWISSDTKTAVKAHLDLVLKLYASVSDQN